MQYTTRINAVLHCGLLRVNAARTGSIWISIGNRNPCKNFDHDQNFFLRRIVLPESIRNLHGLRCGSLRVEPGRYGFNSVWTRFEIRLCVTAFTECRPHSKVFWAVSTRVDLHLIPDSPAPTLVDPQRQTIKESLWNWVKPVFTRFELQRLLPTCTRPFHIPVTNF
jgi:hypothetical protein